jgi:type IV pilus assembly protein PilV
MRGYHKARQYDGVSLIEVMVAVLVLGIGVMGYAALQVKSVHMSEETYSTSQAMSIAQDFIERARVNPEGIDTYRDPDEWSGQLALPAKTCLYDASASIAASSCSAPELARKDIYDTRLAAQSLLANGTALFDDCGTISCITVAWASTLTEHCDQVDFSNGDRGDNAHCVVLEFVP